MGTLCRGRLQGKLCTRLNAAGPGDFLTNSLAKGIIRLLMYAFGRIAQLVRAPRLHRGGQGFESLFAHTN
jgi:hypothetical protein